MEFVRICDLRLHRFLIQGFGCCPPSTTQIVGWIVGEPCGGSGILTEPAPLRRLILICYMVSYHRGWKSRSKRNPSSVAARQWPDSARLGREGSCPPIDYRRSRIWTKRAITHPAEQDRRVRRPVDRDTAGPFAAAQCGCHRQHDKRSAVWGCR